MIEVNPRPWGSISLPVFAGYNFPLEAVKVFYDSEGYKIDKENRFKTISKKYYMRWLLPGDFLSIILDIKIGFKDKFRYIFKRYPNTVYQIIDKNDIKPTFVMFLKIVFNFFNFKYLKKHLLRK